MLGFELQPKLELELPLIGPSASDVSSVGTALVGGQAKPYSAGVLLYCAGFIINGASDYCYFRKQLSLQAYQWYFFVFALLQTAGLMCMASANVDANLHMRRRPMLAAFVAVVIVQYCGLNALSFGTDKLHLVRGCLFIASF